jgi:uncharacterized protein YndB with AHSA1/START domain
MAKKSAKLEVPAKPTLPLGKGKIGFKVTNSYEVSPKKLWNAITKSKHLNNYFTDVQRGELDDPAKSVVVWYWKKWGEHPIWPTLVQKEKKLEFVWMNHKKTYLTMVSMTLKKKGKLVELAIEERGWVAAHLDNAFDNCHGWTMFLDYLKAYAQHDIDLRTEKA